MGKKEDISIEITEINSVACANRIEKDHNKYALRLQRVKLKIM